MFGHATQLAGPDDRFVSINNDTVYSIANVDVSGGPVSFRVPDCDGRYYVMQFVDAWTNNFAYVGHRATGTAAGRFLLVSPDWVGETPEDATVIRFPTSVATILGRWAVAGEADLLTVRELQQQLELTQTAAGNGLPELDPGVSEDLRFFEQLRVWMQAFPPAGRDLAYQARFEPLGLFATQSPYVDPDADLAAALKAGLAQGQEKMEQALTHSSSPEQNGWQLTYHVFDYNLDFFEVGAVDDQQWKLPDGPRRYIERALAARAGLWGNHGYEAAYAMVYNDGDGNPLDGSHRYELRFSSPPPCDAFWSVTMYEPRGSSWSRTRSTATRSVIAPPNCTPPRTARSRSSSSMTSRQSPSAPVTGCQPPTAGSGRCCACTSRVLWCSTAATSCHRLPASTDATTDR